MEFIKIKNQAEAGRRLAEKMGEYFGRGEKVLWLLSGGSNIIIEVEILNILKNKFRNDLDDKLAVTLTDERYGPVGHADSNWQQLIDAGFDFTLVKYTPILNENNLGLKGTVIDFGKRYRDLKAWADIIIGQFGIGTDGHTAGVLPGTVGVKDQATACGYQSDKFTRITLTLKTIRNINIDYTFAFGENKKEIVKKLKMENIPLSEMPAQILKEVGESYLFSD
jgi:6-phosphogluconolactonase/glucosamine-6-phosphate isomerase/deaminase